ncbi:MAG: alpha/beta hydrolase [Terrimicrobiaceae bacterium]
MNSRPDSPFFPGFPITECPEPSAVRPSLVPFWPSSGSPGAAAVIICPGGGYWERMDDYEGRDFALWLNERGVAAFVLRYRLASSGFHYPEITDDMTLALRTLRLNAAAWGLDRIGVMGASAGGHLASYALTHFDEGARDSGVALERTGSRPDFGILCYPVITFTAPGAVEQGTRKNLLGDNPDPELAVLLSNELHVTPQTPPCFLWHTRTDETVLVENSLLFAEALQKHGVHHTLRIYDDGPHGIGLGVKGWHPGHPEPLHPWTHELAAWLTGEDSVGFAKKTVVSLR